MEMTELAAYLAAQNLNMTEDMQNKLLQYADLLREWNEKMNLTSITELPEVIEKHFLDCALPLLACHIEGRVADVGSGAGFPGLVFAILRPDLELTLIEPTGKRCQFLQEVVHKLSLANVRIVNERAEDFVKLNREKFDFTTARAVAALPILSELCLPLTREGGCFAAMKGSMAEQECAQAAHALQILGGSEPVLKKYTLPTAGERTIALITKVRSTPSKYPRAYGQIKKKPL